MNNLRKQVLRAARDHFQSLVRDLEARQQAHRNQIRRNNEPTDLDERAQSDQASEEMRRENEQLIHARESLAELAGMEAETPHQQAEIGAIVHTNSNRFLLGVAVPHFEVEGKSYVGISRNSPAYEKLHGKHVGEQFELKGNIYKVKEIH